MKHYNKYLFKNIRLLQTQMKYLLLNCLKEGKAMYIGANLAPMSSGKPVS